MTAAPNRAVPALLLTRDERHGVTIAARRIAEAVAIQDPRVEILAETASTGTGDLPPRVHAHFTDRLWGASPEAAADRVEALAARTALTVTLHDVPQPSDGPANLGRRVEAYARVVRAADGVVVNSAHESALLSEAGIDADRSAVIPLAVDREPGEPDQRHLDGTVAVLGYFYPGKGHAEVVDAVASLTALIGRTRSSAGAVDGTTVVSLGGVSPGHDEELAELVSTAAARGVRLEVSGFLSADALLARCRAVSVPVVAHRHFSASGSLATWIAAGRRPLVVDSRYAREMAALRPGTVTLVDDDDLPGAVARALQDPASTLLGPDAVTAPGIAEVAEAYLRWWRDEGDR